MQSSRRYRVSAQTATTVTLVPADGEQTKGDFADSVSQIVITFTNARDSNFFDIVNRGVEFTIRRR